MVAISGRIIPDPFAIPIIENFLSLIRPSSFTIFLQVSVVRMASAKSSTLFFERRGTISGTPVSNLFIGRFAPITPVEEIKTRSLEIPSSVAAIFEQAMASSIPFSPVKQLALPLLTSTAWHKPFLIFSFPRITGAATTMFRVNKAAATAGFSQYMSPRSF